MLIFFPKKFNYSFIVSLIIHIDYGLDGSELRGGPVLDGRLYGDDDPVHPAPRPPLRVGHRPVQAGLPHHHSIYRYYLVAKGIS